MHTKMTSFIICAVADLLETYCPPLFCALLKINRRMRIRKQAQEIYFQNFRESTIYNKLPLELILRISDHTAPADRCAFAISCSKTWHILRSSLQETILNKEEREDIELRLANERYLPLAEAEMRTQASHTLKSLLCFNCLKKHHHSAFSAEEMSKDPYHRACVGSQGKLRLCSHRTLSFRELKEIFGDCPADRWSTDKPTLSCRIAHPSQHIPLIFWDHHRRLVLSEHLGSIGSWPHEAVHMDAIREMLNEVDRPICSHWHSSDAEVYDALTRSARAVWKRYPQARPYSQDSSRSRATTSGNSNYFTQDTVFCPPGVQGPLLLITANCPQWNCGTSIHASRLLASKRLDLSIMRNLGRFETPTDPLWCAQVGKVESDE